MSSDKEKPIRAVFLFDIIGRPKEYLVETLEKIIEELGKEKGVKVVSKRINEPVVMKDNKDFFTDFAEVEVEVEEVIILALLMFKYMPAHIEVISPEMIYLPNTSWSEILSELTRRLHGYDEVARIMQNEKTILEAKLREILEQNKNVEEEVKRETKVKRKKKKNE